MKGFYWEVHWNDRNTGNSVMSGAGPYQCRYNSEAARDACIENISRHNHRLDNYFNYSREISESERFIEDIEPDDYLASFEILESNLKLRRAKL